MAALGDAGNRLSGKAGRLSAGVRPLGLAVALALLAMGAQAAELGRPRLLSGVGERLQVEIPVRGLTAGAALPTVSALANTADDAAGAASDNLPITFDLRRARDGSTVVVVASDAPVLQPVVNLDLQLAWAQGSARRQLALLLPAPMGRVTSAAVPVSQPAPARTAGETVAVRDGDTLGEIARRLQASGQYADASLYQVLAALLQANASAFIQGNMHLVRAGVQLALPDAATVRAIDPDFARRLFAEHREAFLAYRGRLAQTAGVLPPAPGTTGSVAGAIADAPRLSATPPSQRDELRLSSTRVADAAGGRANQAEIDRLRDEQAATSRALAEANARVSQLEGNIGEMSKLLELQNNALAALQSPGGAAAANGAAGSGVSGAAAVPGAAGGTGSVAAAGQIGRAGTAGTAPMDAADVASGALTSAASALHASSPSPAIAAAEPGSSATGLPAAGTQGAGAAGAGTPAAGSPAAATSAAGTPAVATSAAASGAGTPGAVAPGVATPGVATLGVSTPGIDGTIPDESGTAGPRTAEPSIHELGTQGPGTPAQHVVARGPGVPAPRPDLSRADLARVRAVTRPATTFTDPEPFEAMPAGAATIASKLLNADIFSHPSANLSFEGQQRFLVGNGLFRKDWVPAPSSTQASDGLGPLFNARSCQACHVKDGRGHVPAGFPEMAREEAVGLLLRLSVPPRTEAERELLASGAVPVLPEPVYGHQLQNFAASGLRAEGSITRHVDAVPVALAGGETVVLQKPTYAVERLEYGPMQADVMISPRLAPPMIGLGLLEAIAEADILANAGRRNDPDGVVGKPNRVRDLRTGSVALGRFGWKAGQPSVTQQSADAFSNDMGLSTPMAPNHYGDCTERQPQCLSMPHGAQPRYGEHEVQGDMLDFVGHYSANLGVPARRALDDPRVLDGKRLFYEARCVACHIPKFVTRRDAERPEHRFQLIWPYTDLLLHDMGEGLADERPEAQATGREWRTPPLWGLGLTHTVNERATWLHDGRARSLLEAVLWHGGEAQAARDRVVAMTPDERADLIRFLESL